MTSKEIKDIVCKTLSDKKAQDITILTVSHLTVLSDYFVICTARNVSQAKAVYEAIEEKFSKEYELEPLRVDGAKEGRWIVIDYGGVIIHIFNDDTRIMYCLDKLWADGSNVEKYES